MDDDKLFYQNCPKCGHIMYSVIGSFKSICENCGYKEDCCQ